MAVCDNQFRDQQARRLTVSSHNVLSAADVERLYLCHELCWDTPAGFQCRIISEASLMTAMRPTELQRLICNQISDTVQDENPVIALVRRVGCIDGTYKAAKGGRRGMKFKRKKFSFSKSLRLTGRLNCTRIYKNTGFYVYH